MAVLINPLPTGCVMKACAWATRFHADLRALFFFELLRPHQHPIVAGRGAKKKGCKPQPAPFVHFIDKLCLAVFEDRLKYLDASVILQHEGNAACGLRNGLPVELVEPI